MRSYLLSYLCLQAAVTRSLALQEDEFRGLVIDEENQPELIAERIRKLVNGLLKSLPA